MSTWKAALWALNVAAAIVGARLAAGHGDPVGVFVFGAIAGAALVSLADHVGTVWEGVVAEQARRAERAAAKAAQRGVTG